MLVKFINIYKLTKVFQTLKPGNFELFKYETPEGSQETLIHENDTVLLKITVLRTLDVKISRPYVSTTAIRITDSAGAVIGTTTIKSQNVLMSWNEDFYGVVKSSERKMVLFFEVIQFVPDSPKEYFFAKGKADLNCTNSNSQIVSLGPFGKLEFGIAIIDCFSQEFCQSLITQNSNYLIAKMSDMIAEQVNLLELIQDLS